MEPPAEDNISTKLRTSGWCGIRQKRWSQNDYFTIGLGVKFSVSGIFSGIFGSSLSNDFVILGSISVTHWIQDQALLRPTSSMFRPYFFGIKLRSPLSLVLLPAGPANRNDNQIKAKWGALQCHIKHQQIVPLKCETKNSTGVAF